MDVDQEGKAVAENPEDSEDTLFNTTLEDISRDPRKLQVPRKVSRKRIESAFLQAFELIGGVPRLALWADNNPGQFYTLASKLFPQRAELDVKGDTSLIGLLQQLGSPHERSPAPNDSASYTREPENPVGETLQ